MTANISAEERAIIDYVESDLASSVDHVESEKKRYAKIALTQMNKKKAVSIRSKRR